MEKSLHNVPQVSVCIDDVILVEEKEKKLLQVLDALLPIFEEASLCLNKKKSQFLLASVTQMVHGADQLGIHPLADKMAAICDAPIPTDANMLCCFIGLISFYLKYINNQSIIMVPMYALTE